MGDWRNEIFNLWLSQPETITADNFWEIRKKEREITTRAIIADAANGRSFESIDDAETSRCKFGHDYAAIWLQVNEARLADPYIKYYVTVSAYSEAPYKSIPKRTMADLAKIRPADYLKDLDPAAGDPLTVYRGGGELTASAANCALSWTTDPETAIFFYDRRFDAAQLWQAQIYKKDIIAYYTGRSEYEIIQYRKLKNIEPLDLAADTIAAAMNARKERLNRF